MSTRPTAVVTGASSGIGAATARALAKSGFRVVLGARRLERLEPVAAEIDGVALPLDVTDADSVAAFVAQVPECRLLVNNAGGAKGLEPVAERAVVPLRAELRHAVLVDAVVRGNPEMRPARAEEPRAGDRAIQPLLPARVHEAAAGTEPHAGAAVEEPDEAGSRPREQDRFAVQSHQRAVAAWNSGWFVEEVVPVTVGAGAVAFSDDGRTIMDAGVMRRVLAYSRLVGAPVIAHCEDRCLVGEGVVNEGPCSTRLGLPGTSRIQGPPESPWQKATSVVVQSFRPCHGIVVPTARKIDLVSPVLEQGPAPKASALCPSCHSEAIGKGATIQFGMA